MVEERATEAEPELTVVLTVARPVGVAAGDNGGDAEEVASQHGPPAG